jgi:hypothetical protein
VSWDVEVKVWDFEFYPQAFNGELRKSGTGGKGK